MNNCLIFFLYKVEGEIECLDNVLEYCDVFELKLVFVFEVMK